MNRILTHLRSVSSKSIRFPKPTSRLFSVSVKESKTKDDENEINQELLQLKKDMGSAYANSNYSLALSTAVELQDKVEQLHGTKNSIFISCLNNVALMNKMLGNNDIAMEQYTQTLQLYFDLYQTKHHKNYAATLTNLGNSIFFQIQLLI